MTERFEFYKKLRNEPQTFIEHSFRTLNPGQPYIDNYHIGAICHALGQCSVGTMKRLLITIPPRTLKSQCVSVAYPAWVLGRNPARKIIQVTYSAPLSNDLTRQTRMLVEAPWYSQVFPSAVFTSRTVEELVTNKGGYRYGTSIGGTLTGRGGDIIIIDDPLKASDDGSAKALEDVIEWYKTSLITRLNSPQDGVIIIVMQRLHELDLVGYLLENESDQWTHLYLPAIANEAQAVPIGPSEFHYRKPGDLLDPIRLPQSSLDGLKAGMGSIKFSAQYLQRPVPASGNLIKREWFKVCDVDPLQLPDRQVVQSWDTALKPGEGNDYSVCLTIVESAGKSHLIDVVRVRVGYPELRKLAINLYARHQPSAVLIEDQGSGTSLISDLKSARMQGIIGIKPKGDKYTRISAQSAKIEAGDLFLPQEAHWLADFLKELLGFPRRRHDDQVDALSQYLNWIGERLRETQFTYDMGWNDTEGTPDVDQLFELRRKYGA